MMLSTLTRLATHTRLSVLVTFLIFNPFTSLSIFNLFTFRFHSKIVIFNPFTLVYCSFWRNNFPFQSFYFLVFQSFYSLSFSIFLLYYWLSFIVVSRLFYFQILFKDTNFIPNKKINSYLFFKNFNLSFFVEQIDNTKIRNIFRIKK